MEFDGDIGLVVLYPLHYSEGKYFSHEKALELLLPETKSLRISRKAP